MLEFRIHGDLAAHSEKALRSSGGRSLRIVAELNYHYPYFIIKHIRHYILGRNLLAPQLVFFGAQVELWIINRCLTW